MVAPTTEVDFEAEVSRVLGDVRQSMSYIKFARHFYISLKPNGNGKTGL